MKILINSNINYRKPLGILLKSLCESGFKKLSDVIVVVSQSKEDIGPRMENAQYLCDEILDIEVCVINCVLNNFDYSAYNSLAMYIDNPMIKDHSYFHVLDTSTFDEDFMGKISSIVVGDQDVLSCFHPHSNTCFFGRKVALNYGDNFSIPISKLEAIRLEYGDVLIKDGKHIKEIGKFGNFIGAGDRVEMESKDIYGTGYPRIRFKYPMFGLSKWVLWGQNGDITGELLDNDPFGELTDGR